MAQTDEDGKDTELAKAPAETVADGEPHPAQPKPDEALEPPFKGFDESGRYFVVKIDTRYGYLSLLGFLQEAADWLKFQVARQKQAEIERTVIKPQQAMLKKIGGRFNPFRGK